MVKNMILGMADAMHLHDRGEDRLKTLYCVLTRVQDGGDIDESGDGYYYSTFPPPPPCPSPPQGGNRHLAHEQ